MTQEIKTTCDVCGKIKGESNHWITLWIAPGGHLCIEKGPAHLLGLEPPKDSCGHQCTVQFVARFLANGTLEER